jgi:hypothetical protein
MAARDYRKLHKELKSKYEHSQWELKGYVDMYHMAKKDNDHLNAELTKAVEAFKKQQVQLYEQRGVISFLETKLAVLAERMNDD